MADISVVGVKYARIDANGGIRGYVSQTTYSYLTDLDLKVGDTVVVDSPTEGLTCVGVIDTTGSTAKATKWIIDKVDIEGFKARQAKRDEVLSLRKQLDKMVEEKKTKQRYEEVLGDDPEAKKLLDRLKEISAS